jgi:RNA polymerase sigma-70 factor (ECF subfamily)
MDSTTPSPREREERFQEIYNAAYVDLLRFVRRRVHPTHAEDVVGEIMLVAWRRLDDVPTDLSAARAWLFGVARKILQNTRRRDDRHEAIAVSVLDGLTAPEAAAVLGISSTAFRLRLSRARRTLRRHVDPTTAGERLTGRIASERSPR